MSTLEERILEAINATKLDVAELAHKLGVTRQAVYDWKKGKSLVNMKAENLVELANLSGFEPAWIVKARGPKKKSLTELQEQVLKAMQESPEQHQLLIAELVDSVMKHKSANGSVLSNRLSDERRQREQGCHQPERRKIPFQYKGGK